MSRPSQWFGLAVCLAALPQLLALYTYSEAPSAFLLFVLGWNLAPFAIAAVLFSASAHTAAWGWLTAVALWGTWEVIGVLTSHNSTAGLGFLWGPVWSFTVAGPIGAGVGILHARSQRSNGQHGT